MNDIVSDIAKRLGEQATRRMEYELRGAWRAGYDYVHVYHAPSGISSPGGLARFRFRGPLALPSQSTDHANSIGEYEYAYTWDLTNGSAAKIRDE